MTCGTRTSGTSTKQIGFSNADLADPVACDIGKIRDGAD
jgi:hypothetical protein